MKQDTVKNFIVLTKVEVPQKDINLGDGVSFIGCHAVLGALPCYVGISFAGAPTRFSVC